MFGACFCVLHAFLSSLFTPRKSTSSSGPFSKPHKMTLSPKNFRAERLPWSMGFCIALVAPVTLFLGGMIFTAQLVTSNMLTFEKAFRFTLPIWLPWLIFGPIAVLLSNRFSLENNTFRNTAIHLAALSIICATNCIIMGVYSGNILKEIPLSSGLPRGDRAPLSARVVMDFLTYGILISICHALEWSLRAKEREKRAINAEAHLAKARLSALRMQLHPHFLFNALNGVATLIHTNPAAADDMIANISTLLRLSLDSTNEQEIPLRLELDFLRLYLNIEQVRYGDRLRFQCEVTTQALTAFLPSLLLQPLIENAVRHGLAPQCHTVTISLSASIADGMLHLQIRDDGCGLPPHPHRESSSVQGIGLNNTRWRLFEIYGDNQSLIIQNGPADESSSRGCIVDVKIPYYTEAML